MFLVSGALRFLALGAAALLLATIVFGRYVAAPLNQWPELWSDTRGALFISILILLFLSFIVTVLDTLIRTDAVHLLGEDLIGVAGVVGTLLLFESLIVLSAAIVIVAASMNISNATELIGLLSLAFITIIFLNILHSYLLLVRFFAIGIMRRDVVEV